MVAEELRQFLSVLGVLMDTQLHILAELLVALLVVLILIQFFKKIQAYFEKIFPYELEILVLLQYITRDVQ